MAAESARPGFSFLVCPDSELSRQEIAAMLKRFPPQKGSWERIVFWGDEEPSQQFWESLNQQGFFGGYRAVIARNAEAWPASVWQEISKALSRGYDQIWPIFCLEVECEKNKFKIPAHVQKARCYGFAEKKRWIWTNPGLTGASLQKYVVDASKKYGLTFSRDALDLFCASTRADATAIANELKKMSLVAPDGKVNEDMISVGSYTPDSNAFLCVKKLLQADLPGAWREMARGDAASLLFLLIALLSRELKLFWKILNGENPYIYPSDAQFKKNLAAKLGYKKISDCFSLLADAEWQVKSGSMTPEQALENLAVQITAIFKTAQNPGYGT